MDYSVVARDILEEVGGEANIVNVSHCMTRLRLTLKDESVVSDENVKAIKGVVGVMKKAGQYQIVIGNEVSKCYNEFLKLGKFGDQAGSAPAVKKGSNPVSLILDAISGSMSPVIPAIIGAGMIQVLNIILGWILPAENQTLQLMGVIGNTAFYCLYNGVKTLAFQAKPLGQPHTSKFRKKKYRDTKLEVKKWKTIESQHIVRMISNIT